MGRFEMLAVMIAVSAGFIAWALYALFGHRFVIWWAKYMKFKTDDVEKTTEKVEEILEDEDDAEEEKRTSSGRTKKRTA